MVINVERGEFLILELISGFDDRNRLQYVTKVGSRPEAISESRAMFRAGKAVVIAEVVERMVRDHDPR